MEPAIKLRRYNSVSQTEKVFVESKDKLSNLPDHIAYHILSFLAIRDIAQLSSTSKKCRELCLSIPSLTIDAMKYEKNPFGRIKLMDFIDRFMTRRKGTVISSFCLRWNIQKWIYDEEYRILTWLHNALECSLNSLDLDLCLESGVQFAMPLEVFHCESLRFFKLDLSKGKLKLPSPDGFTNLQSLSLKHVEITDEFFGEWISSFCKFLKKLCLEQCYGVKNVNITSSSLIYIDIRSDYQTNLCQVNISAKLLEFMRLFWTYNSSSGTSLKIHAPNLSKLHWIGFAPDYYCLGKLNSLQIVAMDVAPYPGSIRSHLTNLLRYIDGTKDLRIGEKCIKALFEKGCMASLNNVQKLKILHCSFSDDLVPAMAVFLKGLPLNMETLIIKQCSTVKNDTRVLNLSPLIASGFKAKFWESQNISFILQLKEVEIELFKGENELELVEYLLEHAKGLKKLVILYKPPLPLKIRMKVNEFTMASTANVRFRTEGSLRALELKLLHDVIKE